MILVHSRTTEFHWMITTKNLSMGKPSDDIFTPYSSKKQRRTVKNAKLVFSVKDRDNKHLTLVQLQKKITGNNWKNIRTFRLSASSRNFQYVVFGVKSIVRHYLKVKML